MIGQSAQAVSVPDTSAGQISFTKYLPASERTCAPDAAAESCEFHWLAYVPRAERRKSQVTVECELWRWHDGQWRSVFVPGTRFTPDELHDHGWRYCKPCEPLVAVVRA